MAISNSFVRGNLSADEKREVQSAWENILRRRRDRQRGPAELYSNNAIFLLSLVAPYLGALLAHNNLAVLGKGGRGRKLRSLAIGSYVALITGVSILWTAISPDLLAWLLCTYSFLSALLITLAQSRDTRLGFENRADSLSPIIPGLVAIVLALAQGFVAYALTSASGL
jgi:hypothetical protein